MDVVDRQEAGKTVAAVKMHQEEAERRGDGMTADCTEAGCSGGETHDEALALLRAQNHLVAVPPSSSVVVAGIVVGVPLVEWVAVVSEAVSIQRALLVLWHYQRGETGGPE